MILGQYWIWIWYGILLLGVLGFIPAVQWGWQTHWKNSDEILRGFGTILVSVGMILLLETAWIPLAYGLLALALACFIAAFVVGRRLRGSGRDGAPG